MKSRQFKCTTGTVLNITPISKTSHVVTWLTSDSGKLQTLAKGAYRPRSIFLGQYDLFYTCEVLFYTTKPEGLHIARECTAIDTRTPIRENWRAACAASYICALASKNVTSFRNEHALFEITNKTLDFFITTTPAPQVLLWYELALAGAIGLAPKLSSCTVCERCLPTDTPVIFSVARGGVICSKCSSDVLQQKKQQNTKSSLTETILLPPDILAILRIWQQELTPGFAQNTVCNAGQLALLSDVLLAFLIFHANPAPESRSIALNLLLQHPLSIV